MNRVLLTFTGFHDPYSKGLVGQEDQRGPILSLIAEEAFDRIILFSTPVTEDITLATQKELARIAPETATEIRDVPLTDPTDYRAILTQLRSHLRSILNEQPDASFFIAVASGTPQMHASWVLLAASGEIPAKILHVRPPHFVTKDQSVVSEVDLSSDEFPSIRARISAPERMPDEGGPNLALAIRQLNIVGDHESIRGALEVAAALATCDAPILIQGETGTGKELFARVAHILSGRQKDRFVAINCAAIPKDLVESVLFGHRKGAFTGAVRDQQGKFDLAHGGTLFLDELAELAGDLSVNSYQSMPCTGVAVASVFEINVFSRHPVMAVVTPMSVLQKQLPRRQRTSNDPREL